MRKKNRERTDAAFFDHVLHTAEELFVAFATDGAPYVIPLNFVYDGNKLWIHCATEGRKLDLIRRCPQVGFTAVCDVEILREKSTTLYSSVCGTGVARYVVDVDEKQEALRLLAERYNARCEIPTPPAKLAITGIICIDIDTLVGKHKE